MTSPPAAAVAMVRLFRLSIVSYEFSVPGALPGMLCIEGSLPSCMTLTRRDQSMTLLICSVSALLLFT